MSLITQHFDSTDFLNGSLENTSNHLAELMPGKHSDKAKSHHSDPSTSSLTPLRGTFYSVSPGQRSHSLSPRKRLARQPLHIRMNLTETQMNKITNAFTQKVTSSTMKDRSQVNMETKRSTPRKSYSSQRREDASGTSEEESSQIDIYSPTFSELMPQHLKNTGGSISPSLAERRHRTPAPIQTSSSSGRAMLPQRPQMESVAESISPLTPVRQRLDHFAAEDEVSVYSQDTPLIMYESPSKLNTIRRHNYRGSQSNRLSIDSYKNWAQTMNSPTSSRESPTRVKDGKNRPRRSKSNADGLRNHTVQRSLEPPVHFAHAGSDMAMFSPLHFYFHDDSLPAVKKGEKTMIGDNGWLERTEKTSIGDKKGAQKKAGILDSIKKIAKDMTDFHHTSRRPQHATQDRPSRVAISLDPREQSLLYYELDFRLSNALNDYITVQLDKGCLVPDKLKKVADGWSQKGRPKVVGFRYDLETQLELVNLHISDFRFYGRRQGEPVEISGLLHAMKVNARAMSVRTFCQPDSVIAKQLVDAQSLFKMLGAPEEQQLALVEIAHFFKMVVQREFDAQQERESASRERNMEFGEAANQWQGRATLSGGRRARGQGYGTDDERMEYAR